MPMAPIANDYDNWTNCWLIIMIIVGVSGKEAARGVELYESNSHFGCQPFYQGDVSSHLVVTLTPVVGCFQGLIYPGPIACDCLVGEIKAATVVASNGQAFEN